MSGHRPAACGRGRQRIACCIARGSECSCSSATVTALPPVAGESTLVRGTERGGRITPPSPPPCLRSRESERRALYCERQRAQLQGRQRHRCLRSQERVLYAEGWREEGALLVSGCLLSCENEAASCRARQQGGCFIARGREDGRGGERRGQDRERLGRRVTCTAPLGAKD